MSELLSKEKLLEHWQGHRRLTLRTLEAYPQDQLASYKVEGMRTFAELLWELLNVETAVFQGLATGEWTWEPTYDGLETKAELLHAFGEVQERTKEIYASLDTAKFQLVETDAWGMTASNLERIFYVIDNEIHHRSQGFVYLRLLGLELPKFYER